MFVYLPIKALLIKNKNINNIVRKTIQIYIIICTSTILCNIKKHKMYINVIFQTVSFYLTHVSLKASHSYLYIWVNRCSIISQVIIYLKELKRCSLTNCLVAGTNCLCLNFKSWLVLLNTSSRAARCRLASVSIFLALFYLTPRLALLVVDLSPSRFFLLWFAQRIESLCSLLTCLDCLKPFLLCVAQHLKYWTSHPWLVSVRPSQFPCFVLLNTSTRSARRSVVYLSLSASFYIFLYRTSSCKLLDSLPIEIPMRDWIHLHFQWQGTKCRSRLAPSPSGLPAFVIRSGFSYLVRRPIFIGKEVMSLQAAFNSILPSCPPSKVHGFSWTRSQQQPVNI